MSIQRKFKEWEVVAAKRYDMYDGLLRDVIVIGNVMVDPPPHPITDNKVYIWVRQYYDTEFNFLGNAPEWDILHVKQFLRADVMSNRLYLQELKATVLRKQLGLVFTNLPLEVAEGFASYLM
jgi:hypothetical protein